MKIDFSTVMESLAAWRGDAPAVINVERGRRYSFREYHRLTNRIANMLRGRLGIASGDRYVCILENDSLALMHWVTALKTGGLCCYANYRDDQNTHFRQLDTTKPKVVLIETALLKTYYEPLRKRGIEVIAMDPPGASFPEALSFWELVNAASDANPAIEIDDRSQHVAMRFTGGTTGDSKCALYCADTLLACAQGFMSLSDSGFHENTRAIHLAPISHGSGMLVFPTVLSGGCTLTMNTPDLEQWCASIEREQVTLSMVVPTLAYRLLEMNASNRFDLKSLTHLYYGAAPMAPDKLERLVKEFGPIFCQGYASTEHFMPATVLSRADHVVEGDAKSRLSSAGRPAPGVEIRIVGDDGKNVAPGEVGEIYLRSRGVCSGYFANPEATRNEFEDGFWKSADLGYADKDGFIHIVDRKKDMIISGGFNIYPTDIEAAICAHPDVLMAAVVGVPHADWGEAVHAEVLMRQGAAFDEDGLRQFLAEKLPAYKKPKTITAVSELPLSPVGKVLRKDVRAKYWGNRKRAVN